MSTGETLLIFIGIPVGFAALVYLAVSAASWTRSGRIGDVARATDQGGAVFLSSASSAPDPSRLPAEIGAASTTLAGGGASGRW